MNNPEKDSRLNFSMLPSFTSFSMHLSEWIFSVTLSLFISPSNFLNNRTNNHLSKGLNTFCYSRWIATCTLLGPNSNQLKNNSYGRCNANTSFGLKSLSIISTKFICLLNFIKLYSVLWVFTETVLNTLVHLLNVKWIDNMSKGYFLIVFQRSMSPE
jgi:hypothetical protein